MIVCWIKVLDKVKTIKDTDDAKIFIETDNKFPDDVTLENFVILNTCVIKDTNKFYPEISLEEALVAQTIISVDKFQQLCSLSQKKT